MPGSLASRAPKLYPPIFNFPLFRYVATAIFIISCPKSHSCIYVEMGYTLGAGVTTGSFSVFVAPRAWCFQPRSSHVCETGVGARLRCSCTLSTQPVLKCTSDGIEHCTVFGGWFKGHVCIVVARDNSQLIHRAFSSRQKSFVPQYRIGSFPRGMALQHSFLPSLVLQSPSNFKGAHIDLRPLKRSLSHIY